MRILNSAFYEDISDYVILYAEDIKKYISNFSILKKSGIIYCKTDFIPLLFDHLRFSNRNYILITHHSDFPIDEFRFRSKPECIKKWYAINVVYEHPNLIPIPLGTKTPKGRAYYEKQYNIDWFVNLIASLDESHDFKIISSVYCNWGDTNSARNQILSKLKVPYYKSSGLNFKEYSLEMADYQFIISPPGNGIDCHRTWEALYLGCYPIVKSHYIYDAWKDLPIIQVSDYSEISKDLLEYHKNKLHNMEKLYTNYWIKKIKNI